MPAHHRGIATLASAMMVCFFVLSTMEPDFVVLHFYQSIIYLVIVLMLFYFEDRWAYMLGMMVPAVWLLLAYGLGMVGGAMRQVSRLMRAQRPTSDVSTMIIVMVILAVGLIAASAYRWRREYAGQGKTLQTVAVSAIAVIAYYGILIYGFFRTFSG